MSISWELFWFNGPLSSRRAKPFRPSDCADVTRREASIMSISWELFWFNGPLSSRRLQNPFDRVIVQM